MRRLAVSLAAAACGLLMAPSLASALTAITTDDIELRAGPASDFPVVDSIPSDAHVDVHGCVRGYRWCDVSWRDARGWMPGSELAYLYDGRRVAVIEYGPRIGLPVIGFAFDTYWDRHYRGRSWYGNRSHWRTVWRGHGRDDRRTSDRVRERREGSNATRTERSRVDRTERRREGARREQHQRNRTQERAHRQHRPDVRTGRSESRDRGPVRGYRPMNPGRQQMQRAPHNAPAGRGGGGHGNARSHGGGHGDRRH